MEAQLCITTAPLSFGAAGPLSISIFSQDGRIIKGTPLSSIESRSQPSPPYGRSLQIELSPPNGGNFMHKRLRATVEGRLEPAEIATQSSPTVFRSQ